MPKRKGPGGYRAAKNYLPRVKRGASPRRAHQQPDRESGGRSAGHRAQPDAVESRMRELEQRERQLARREQALAARIAREASAETHPRPGVDRGERLRRERSRDRDRPRAGWDRPRDQDHSRDLNHLQGQGEHPRDRDRSWERGASRDRDRPRDRDRSWDRDASRDQDRSQSRDRSWDQDRPWDRDRSQSRLRERGRPRDGQAPRDRKRTGRADRREGRYLPPEDVVLERLHARTITREEAEGVTFAQLGLGDNITRALAELGAASPFPIQVATIPDAIGGRDVLGRGRTGSGKTIAFGAAIVERLLVLRPKEERSQRRRAGRPPRALVIAPTRELAMQIDRTVQPIARSVGLFTTQLVGGMPQAKQAAALRRGVDIVIGTPGRIEDMHRQGRLELSEVVVTVLDEADQMCDLGFLEPMQRILRLVRPGGQRLLFSATLDAAVLTLVEEFLDDPAVHEVAGESQDHADIEHRVLVVDRRDKDEVIRQLAGSGGRVLVFARTRLGAERIADELELSGIPAVALHGDLSQARRTRHLQQLTRGRVSVLVATDVAARGIHVDDIRLVIQADAPDEYKTYLHRSGRTGRAGNAGTVVTLIPAQRRRRMQELLERAEVDAPMIPARPGGPELDEFAMEQDAPSAARG